MKTTVTKTVAEIIKVVENRASLPYSLGRLRFDALPQSLKLEIEESLLFIGETSEQFMVDLLEEMTGEEFKFWLFMSLNPENVQFK